MKIIVTGAPLIGHLNPVLAMGRALAELGHEVVGYAPTVFRQNVEKSGMAFHAFPPDADIDMRDIGKFLPPRDPALSAFAWRKIAWQHIFTGRMREDYRGLQALLRAFPADVILSESMFFGTMPMLVGPRAERPAIVHMGATFLQLTRDDKAPMFEGLPPARTAEDREAYGKLATRAREEWFDPIDQSINAMLAELDRPTMPMPFYDAAIKLPDLYLHTGAPGLEFPRETLPSTVKYVGTAAPVGAFYPIPEWASDLDDGRKVVLVTQGTVANSDLDRLIRPTLSALSSESDLIVVATTGGRSIDTLGPLPGNARVAQFLPYDWLMPKVDLLVTNGGYGTVTHALSLGVPLVVAGTTEDKREVSARVQWSRVGLALGTDNPTVPQIRDAVRQVLDIPSFASKAAMLAKEFREHALGDGIGQLFADLA
jgi:MGT family glycosyltransferase